MPGDETWGMVEIMLFGRRDLHHYCGCAGSTRLVACHSVSRLSRTAPAHERTLEPSGGWHPTSLEKVCHVDAGTKTNPTAAGRLALRR